MALSAGARLGPYEIVSALGAGGMGEVYRARDTKLDRDVAIKVLPAAFVFDPERVARFQREAKTIAALNHPNIAAIYGVDERDGTAALVLELVEGPTLADRIAGGPIPSDEALPIAKQIAEALEAAHEHGIIHRDLKPANIKVRADGTVKVLDFGLAKALEPAGHGTLNTSQSPTAPAMTEAGMILGTVAYMSPEQARGKPVDKRTDLWAFGCVLYEMLTGRRTFAGDDRSDTLAQVLTTVPDWSVLPPATPEPIRRLLARCLEKDRKRRLADMADAQLEIYEALNPTSTTGAVPATSIGRPFWRRAAVTAAGVLAVAALAATATCGVLKTRADARPTSRLSIVLPPERPLANEGGDRDIAIAPDGSFIVYRTILDTTSHLAVRRLDELDSKLLEGTAGARSPFISPDGRWVGFFAGTTLKKIPVAGGPPINVCENTHGMRGGAWDENDTIIFSTNDRSTGLLSVPAEGGTPTALTRIDDVKLDDHLYPSVVPGTSLVLFTVSLGGQRQYNVAALDRRTGEFNVLIPQASQAEYLDGRILYVSNGTLRMTAFDADRRAVSGESVPVVESVLTFVSGAANFGVSRNGTLLYVPGTSTPSTLGNKLVWVDRGGNQEVISGASGAFLDPRLSPDGTQVLVEDMNDSDDLWSLNLANGSVGRQTFESAQDETPRWSPDGHWIAYAAGPLGTATTRSIFRRRADGSGSEELLWDPKTHVHVDDWTPDGNALLISTSDSSGGQGDIFLLRLDGGDRNPSPLLQTRFDERGARVSPDGRWIAYYSNEAGRNEVFVRSFPKLEGKWQISVGGGTQPVWAHDAKELFYRAGSVVAVAITSSQTFSFGPPRRLFLDRFGLSSSGNHTGFDVSRDGKRFLMVRDEGPAGTSAPANFVVAQNWLQELKSRVPAR